MFQEPGPEEQLYQMYSYSDDNQRQKAIVHQPPERPPAPLVPANRAETGLSQPDLSTASDGSDNPPYAVSTDTRHQAVTIRLYSVIPLHIK